ncbi:hypothetical protein [Allokutzneria albata]|uniref:hypothetical protein n=1 Tax=Allokutzneria albata TaxID=211114 RepID=UPI0004C38488|nr:hypothetical protein [Allokutzneria albata]
MREVLHRVRRPVGELVEQVRADHDHVPVLRVQVRGAPGDHIGGGPAFAQGPGLDAELLRGAGFHAEHREGQWRGAQVVIVRRLPVGGSRAVEEDGGGTGRFSWASTCLPVSSK